MVISVRVKEFNEEEADVLEDSGTPTVPMESNYPQPDRQFPLRAECH